MTYPRKFHGRTIWACCVSVHGPQCLHLPDEAERLRLMVLRDRHNNFTTDGLGVLITDENAPHLIGTVSIAVGRDVSPYNRDGSVDYRRFANGVNLAPYLRSCLRRWAVKNG